MPVSRQWLSNVNVVAVTDTYAIIQELLETVFSVRFVPRRYKEDQLLSPVRRESPETAVTRVGSWCEMAVSLRVREPGIRGTSTVGSRYQAAQ
jgi:hypothetical protein